MADRTQTKRKPRTRPANNGSLETRIRDRYPDLPASERRIADLILEFPGEMAAYSATELAQLAGGSKAAVTRLIRRLGFDSFEAARRSARRARDWGSPLYLLSRAAEVGVPTDSQLQRHLAGDLANMARTFEALDPDELDAIVEALATARRLWLLGYRNSHALAAYARLQFVQLRDDVALLPLGGETLAESLASMSRADLLVVFGFRRRVPQVGRAMAVAHGQGVPILYITDPTVRETVTFARWTLLAEVGGVGVFDSYAAAISLVHYLASALVARTGAAGRRRLKRIEDMHDDLADLG
jgi:DNA-binding MurR/RpiR family transcriptional regulator